MPEHKILDVIPENEKQSLIDWLSDNNISLETTSEEMIREHYYFNNIIEKNPVANIIYGTISDYVQTHDLPKSEQESISIIRSLSDLIGNTLNEQLPEDLSLGLGHFNLVIHEESLMPRPGNIWSALVMCCIDKAAEYDSDEAIEELNQRQSFIDYSLMFKFEYFTINGIRDVHSKKTDYNQIVRVSNLDHNPPIPLPNLNE